MKKKFFIFAVMVGVVTLFCVTAVYAENKLAGDVDAKIQVFSDSFLTGNPPPQEECKKAFNALIEAMVLTLPQAGCPAEFNDNIAKANDLFKKNGIFDHQGAQSLHEAYRIINDGNYFQIPGDLKEMNDVMGYLKKWVSMSRENLKQGKMRDAVKDMLKVAIMVVTPMERKL
ncbi:MAG: hypothetical protein EHM45_21025 [Desulfobacteraceae bacterium]|nr:MAG: hypothetical protein EHM45_21025 [Desulfobacteraceae bacterium]